MGKDPHLINIYLKIHNKKTLTMDDLRYLAQYSPECFEKTCKNVIYNIPESKPIMEPAPSEVQAPPQPSKAQELPCHQPEIESILANLKRLETDDFPITDINADEVKNLLGNLYMELLFPHNDQDTFMNMMESKPLFDRKI